jgi:hypothetical protein
MKKNHVYLLILLLPLIIALNINFAFAAEEVSTMMCDNGIVNIGDLNTAVQDKCGEPSTKRLGVWVYNFGPDEPVYTVIFDGGQVVRILEDEWGS